VLGCSVKDHLNKCMKADESAFETGSEPHEFDGKERATETTSCRSFVDHRELQAKVTNAHLKVDHSRHAQSEWKKMLDL